MNPVIYMAKKYCNLHGIYSCTMNNCKGLKELINKHKKRKQYSSIRKKLKNQKFDVAIKYSLCEMMKKKKKKKRVEKKMQHFSGVAAF